MTAMAMAVTTGSALAAAPTAPTPPAQAAVGPATQPTPAALFSNAGTSACAAPVLSQPFLSAGDSNLYTLAPGESADNFAGTGWTLSRGANIVTAQLADGQTGSVLDLPRGSYAISPPICVQSDYPTARTMIQTPALTTVLAGVTYANRTNLQLSNFQLSGIQSGDTAGWVLSDPLQVFPGTRPGWQLVQFAFAAAGTGSDAQLYDFYIDPRMSN